MQVALLAFVPFVALAQPVVAAAPPDAGAPLLAPSSPPPPPTGNSTVHFICPEEGVTLTVTPGKHGIEAKDQLNHLLGRGSVEVASGTEIFVVAAKGGVTVTNRRPLSK